MFRRIMLYLSFLSLPALRVRALYGLYCLGAVFILTGVAACGVASVGGTGGTPTGTTGSQVATATPGPVTVALQGTTPSSTATLKIVVTNHASHTIYVSNHHTDCTVIQLQVASSWRSVYTCSVETAQIDIPLAAGDSMTVSLPAPRGGWKAGLYRGVAFYSLGSTSAPKSMTVSSEFQIG